MPDIRAATDIRGVEEGLGKELKDLGKALDDSARSQRVVADAIAKFGDRLLEFREACDRVNPGYGALFQDREGDMRNVADRLRKEAERNISLAGEFKEIGLQVGGPDSVFYQAAKPKHPLGLQLTWVNASMFK